MLKNKVIRQALIVLIICAVVAAFASVFIGGWIAVILFSAVAIACVLTSVSATFKEIQVMNLQLEKLMSGKDVEFETIWEEGEISILSTQLDILAKRIRASEKYQAEEKKRMSDFIADISHQLKTPLTSLRMFTEQQAELAKNQLARDSMRQLDKMEWLIQSLIKIARFEAGIAEMTFLTNDLTETLHEARRTIVEIFPERDEDIEITSMEPVFFRFDARWLEEAIVNLLKNACINSQAGSPIKLYIQSFNDIVSINVEDSGKGISQEDLPYIFERFYRTKEQHSNSDGAGIGLNLVREITKNHHGVVCAENKSGGGAIFAISLPRI